MKIFYFIETKRPGGAERVYLTLIEGMLKRGYKVYAGVTGRGWVYEEVNKLGITPCVIPTDGSHDVKFLKNIIRIVKEKNIDLIHSHLLGANLYSNIAGFLTGKKIISTFHGTADISSSKRGKFFRLKGKIISLCSTRIVAVSQSLKKALTRDGWLQEKKIEVIYNGIDTSKYSTLSREKAKVALGFDKEEIIIGKVGNIRKPKGHKYFLKACAILAEKFPQARFLITGHAKRREDVEELKTLSKDLGIENRVVFTGYREDIEAVFSALDVYVLASIEEGFSISTVEAMACGVPVVCTRSGGPEEIVIHEKNGLLVSPCNSEALASAVIRVLENRELALKMINEGKKTAKRFSIDTMLNQYENLYLECVGIS
jgi:glycosyltransferase involved in cell wall biosynthesis